MKGWVYIITNKSMPNLVNIGFSTTDPVLKADELNKSEPPHPYVVEYDALVNEPKEIAPKLQAILSYCHENKSWFCCDIAKAIVAIRQAAEGFIIVEDKCSAEIEAKKPQLSKTEPDPQNKVIEESPAKKLAMRDLYRSAIGEKNCDYYLNKFAEFDRQPEGLKTSWNWFAFLFTGFWALYRKMYLWFFMCWGVAAVFKMFENVLDSGLWTLIYWVAALSFGIFANSLYHANVKRRIAAVQLTVKDESKLLAFLDTKAGVNDWVSWGLGGVAILGIVASIAIPKLSNNGDQSSTVVTPSNSTDAVAYEEHLRKNAEQGDVKSQELLGGAYFYGLEGFIQDYTQAVFWNSKAAKQGSVISQSMLGDAYSKGEGIAKDEVQAAYWFQKAAEQGDASGQYELGHAYSTGKGIAKDAVQAAYWFHKSAEQGNFKAQLNLGVMYESGEGLVQDEVQAVYWYRKVAAKQDNKQGSEFAQNALKRLGY